jgi:putative transposase
VSWTSISRAKQPNHRNGYRPRRSTFEYRATDREGTFDPRLIAHYQRRFPGFDEKIVSMYARGMTTREIQGHPLEFYGLDVSTRSWRTVAEWQNRPLEVTPSAM